MLNKLQKTLMNPRKMAKFFVSLFAFFLCLTVVFFTNGFAYLAGFTLTGAFISVLAAAINATIISSSGAETMGETEDGSIW